MNIKAILISAFLSRGRLLSVISATYVKVEESYSAGNNSSYVFMHVRTRASRVSTTVNSRIVYYALEHRDGREWIERGIATFVTSLRQASDVVHSSDFSRTGRPNESSTNGEISVASVTEEETIPPLSLNYLRALAGTCVRYGVMDDALGKPSLRLPPAFSLEGAVPARQASPFLPLHCTLA